MLNTPPLKIISNTLQFKVTPSVNTGMKKVEKKKKAMN